MVNSNMVNLKLSLNLTFLKITIVLYLKYTVDSNST